MHKTRSPSYTWNNRKSSSRCSCGCAPFVGTCKTTRDCAPCCKIKIQTDLSWILSVTTTTNRPNRRERVARVRRFNVEHTHHHFVRNMITARQRKLDLSLCFDAPQQTGARHGTLWRDRGWIRVQKDGYSRAAVTRRRHWGNRYDSYLRFFHTLLETWWKVY